MRDAGTKVTVVNRGSAPAPEGVTHLRADRNDEDALRRVLDDRHFAVGEDASPFSFGRGYAMDNGRATALGFRLGDRHDPRRPRRGRHPDRHRPVHRARCRPPALEPSRRHLPQRSGLRRPEFDRP
ncbi:hypothetical protein [Microbispora rosea]|uniref:hypothetical protein n=1 Tax=Microbispora rosea TaxID=58117 RepID=UPI0034176D66